MVPVLIAGGTVHVRTHETCGILLGTGDLYWIEFHQQPELKSFPLDAGTFVWVYYIKEKRKITGVVLGKGVRKEDLPQADPVEIEERIAFERSDYCP